VAPPLAPLLVKETVLQPTNTTRPDYFHKVVDCQWACPAHTPVPEYIRLIGQGRYSDAYMINWVSNVFPGVSGSNLRPTLRARLSARSRRGKQRSGTGAGSDLPTEAGRCR
jgi:formate dehydrogenase beta subunit